MAFKITILTDQTSWMNKYDSILMNQLKKAGHKVDIIHSVNELEKGDIAFFLSCFDLVKGDQLLLNNHNIVVHASDLPKGKGWSPATWQILEGKNIIPLTLFEANEKVDAGEIYIKDQCKLDGTELIQEWQAKIAEKIVKMCIEFVQMCEHKKDKGTPQQGEETFYKKRVHANSALDINKTIAEQFNLLRTVNNDSYPAFFKINSATYKIKIEKVKEDV